MSKPRASTAFVPRFIFRAVCASVVPACAVGCGAAAGPADAAHDVRTPPDVGVADIAFDVAVVGFGVADTSFSVADSGFTVADAGFSVADVGFVGDAQDAPQDVSDHDRPLGVAMCAFCDGG